MSNGPRYRAAEIEGLVETVLRDGYCVLHRHIDPTKLETWREHFLPMLDATITKEGSTGARGAQRYYVTLPFLPPFDDASIWEDDDVLAVVEGLVGEEAAMSQLATDTPLLGSEHQDIHRDAQPLFPETGKETPPFQLALNIPLVRVTRENGPVEIAKGTHCLSKADAMQLVESGKAPLEPVPMELGDVMVRDVRGLHRGTPNMTSEPRPMVVLGYNRKWLFRPEVSIRVPRAALARMSERGRRLLRFNPVVETASEAVVEAEVYQAFAY